VPLDPKRVQNTFLAAVDAAEGDARAALLDRECGADVELRQRVEALLRAHDHPDGLSDPGSVLPEATGPHRAAPRTDEEPALAVGTVVAGRYKILECLGEGGMGTIYVAEQTQPVRRKVALKLIKAGMDSRRVLARFEQERQALALMDHPNIAKVLDGGTTAGEPGCVSAGRPFFVMEYIKGVPLTAYCDAARLTIRQRLELFISVCQAVQHAHQKGIIHRDLKPSNVLVALYDGHPVPKVIDFGLAKAMHQPLTERTLYTAHELVLGTPLYMSPEQAELNNLDIDTRSDIYTLGVILYELLTGETPLERQRFKQAAWDEKLRLIRQEEPPKPSTRLSRSATLPAVAAQRQMEPVKLARLLRGELDWIVMKALDKDRNRRYETANGLARDIERYLAQEPVSAGPPTAGYRLRKFLRRNRGPVLAAAVLLLALVGGVVGTSWGLVEARRQRDAAEAAHSQEAAQRREAVAQKERAEGAEARATRERDKAVAEKRRADQEASVAKAVNEFLQKDLLGQADIGNQAGGGERNRNITVRELLDRAARGIEGKFRGQEVTEAAIRLTLGEAYWALGEFAEAQRHLEQSLALRRQKLGADHPDTCESLNDLALVHWRRGLYDEAEPLYRQALEGWRARLGADDPQTLIGMNNLALLYKYRGRYEEAEALYKQVLDTRRTKLGADHPHTLGSMHNLATLYQNRGRYDEAEPLLRQALEGQRAKLGADHPETLNSIHSLATLYQNRGRHDEAEPLYKQVLDTCRAKLGAGHPQTLSIMTNLAALYEDRGRYDEAEPIARDCLAIRQKKQPDDWTTFNAQSVLGGVLLGQKKYAQAEPLLLQGFEGMQRRVPTIPAQLRHRLVQAQKRLVELYEAMGHKDKAAQWRKKLDEARAPQKKPQP
jgi:serine/threonine protein kinase/Flp pilus assembly protein TadD